MSTDICTFDALSVLSIYGETGGDEDGVVAVAGDFECGRPWWKVWTRCFFAQTLSIVFLMICRYYLVKNHVCFFDTLVLWLLAVLRENCFIKGNVYPKFSVEFWWVKRRCSYHPSNAIYSPINHSFTPSKNLYFRENLGSKFVGDDNLIFHAVYRVTDENGKNYLSGRVWGR